MHDRIGIIGVGAMGSALLKGMLDGAVSSENVMIADAAAAKLQQVADLYNVAISSVSEIAASASVIFLAVKPQDIKPLLLQMAQVMQDGQLVVSVAAGITIAELKQNLPEGVGVIRVMPNTPCLIGEGAMAISADSNVPEKDMEMVLAWLSKMGIVCVVPEKLLDAVTGLSGSGPAYVFMMIEALADGGVLAGLPRELAQELAVQTVLGSAKMVKVTGNHPAILREMVTSPGGTTAAALFELEEGAFRGTLQKAVKAAVKRSKELDN